MKRQRGEEVKGLRRSKKKREEVKLTPWQSLLSRFKSPSGVPLPDELAFMVAETINPQAAYGTKKYECANVDAQGCANFYNKNYLSGFSTRGLSGITISHCFWRCVVSLLPHRLIEWNRPRRDEDEDDGYLSDDDGLQIEGAIDTITFLNSSNNKTIASLSWGGDEKNWVDEKGETADLEVLEDMLSTMAKITPITMMMHYGHWDDGEQVRTPEFIFGPGQENAEKFWSNISNSNVLDNDISDHRYLQLTTFPKK